MTDLSLLKRELPKWPQMIVNGERISIPQAREIIRRTDLFFAHASDEPSSLILRAGFRMPPYRSWDGNPVAAKDIRDFYAACESWRTAWGWIGGEYLYNDWIHSAYISGATGWCHPDGWIEHHGTVGKYPSTEELLKEWNDIAGAFPFLKLDVTLMDEHTLVHHGKQSPIIGFKIRDGQAELVDPFRVKLHADYSFSTPSGEESDAFETIPGPNVGRYQCLIPEEWFEIWFQEADRIFKPTSEAAQRRPDQ